MTHTTHPQHQDAGKDRHAVERTFAKIERQIYDILVGYGVSEKRAEKVRKIIETAISWGMEEVN